MDNYVNVFLRMLFKMSFVLKKITWEIFKADQFL